VSATIARRKRRLQIERGSLATAGPPFSAVLRLDGGRHGLRHLAAVALALFAHSLIGAAAALQHEATDHPKPPAVHLQLRATLQRAPPPPPPPPLEPPRARQPEARAPRPTPRPSPPSPAQAGRVIAQAPEPSGPADLTSFDLVVGQGESYAGGVSSALGKSRSAVTDPGALIGGVPDAPARPAQDLSRPASPLRRDWACAWPDEAQDSELRDARATIRVSVAADGTPGQIDVLAAPPGGFGEAARRCAEHEEFRSALDAAGKPIAAATHLFNVHFLR
jgi:periplasmic protein TonB